MNYVLYANGTHGITCAQLLTRRHRDLVWRAVRYRNMDTLDISNKSTIYVCGLYPTTHELTTLALDRNVIFYCSPETVEQYNNIENVDVRCEEGIAPCEFIRNEMLDNNEIGINDFVYAAYVGDYHMWTFKDPDTLNFIYGMEVMGTARTALTWCAIETYDERLYTYVKNNGKLVAEYLSIRNGELNKLLTYPAKFHGYNALCMNYRKDSGPFQYHDNLDYIDLFIAYEYQGISNRFAVSLYSNTPKLDVSTLSKKYHGGGKPNVAGFSCKELPFEMLEMTRSSFEDMDKPNYGNPFSTSDCMCRATYPIKVYTTLQNQRSYYNKQYHAKFLGYDALVMNSPFEDMDEFLPSSEISELKVKWCYTGIDKYRLVIIPTTDLIKISVSEQLCGETYNGGKFIVYFDELPFAGGV
jgi:hypothetical protein